MATELVSHASPAQQFKTSAAADPEIDIEVRHPFIPWRFNNFTYQRNFSVAPTTITLFKRWGGLGTGAIESEIVTITLGVGQTTAFFDRTVELGHGEAVRAVSSGAEPDAGGELHSISIIWEEKRNSQG